MIFLLLTLSLLYSISMYRRTNPSLTRVKKISLALLRFVTLGIVLSFLFFPIFKTSKLYLVKPRALVLIDNSNSMDLPQDDISKARRVSDFFQEIKDDIEKNFTTDYQNFSSRLAGNRNSSDLIASLADVYSQTNEAYQEIFLLSDGHFRNNNFLSLKEYPFKINTFTFPNNDKELLAKIINIRSNRSAYINEESPLLISIENPNQKKLLLEIRNGDKVINTQEITPNNETIIKQLLNLKFSQLGLYELTINLKENAFLHDTAKLVLKVEDKKKEILFLSDSPDWDSKFIKDAIRLDNHFSYQYITAKNRKFYLADKEISLAKALDASQLLIVNNKKRLSLSSDDIKLLSRKISNGLSVFFIGQVINGLEDYYPVERSSIERLYQAKLIPGYASKNYTTFSDFFTKTSDLPPVEYRYFSLKKSAQEIATMDNMDRSPAISTMRLNKAKILHFAINEFWSFSMRNDATLFRELMLNIVRWLSTSDGDNFLVSTDKDGYYFGEKIVFSASILDEKGDYVSQRKLKLDIYTEDKNKILTDYLLWEKDNYKYDLGEIQAGKYHYEVTDIDTKQSRRSDFIVFNNSLESSHLDFNNLALQEISNVSGGFSLGVNELSDIKDKVKRDKISKEVYKEYKILYNNYLLLLVICTFSLELFFRRRWGLL